MNEEYKPFLKTARFDIFHHRVVRNPVLGVPRDMYTAWFHSEDVPKPACVVTIYTYELVEPTATSKFSRFVEWVEVTSDRRREGIATEVLRALRDKLGQLSLSGATDEGEAFVEAKEEFINA